ncbi:unnamed protein product [Bursaphelenchus xylophilus]|uniref:(pine wood nematode) hypothetical protein n=1 Tax=Bursaphelenchus xylophilus TaxID=6326 RepID=A0A1I7RX53_BURXY|nr:unnamed protein product [Bursaphelenchus xylophilus]CAG9121331.1 unnamed protein product [Bursaphelenchus xylophilus]
MAKNKDWVVLDLIDQDEVIATSVTSCLPGFETVAKGKKGKFMWHNGKEEEAEVMEVCDRLQAKQIAQFTMSYIYRRERRIAERANAESCSKQPAASGLEFSFSEDLLTSRLDTHQDQIDQLQQRVADEQAKNESFQAQILEQLASYKAEIERIKSLPGNEHLGKKVPKFRFLDQDVVEVFYQQAGNDPLKFFRFIYASLFTKEEKKRGIKQLSQEKLLEFEHLFKYYYPQDNPEADKELWTMYRKKMSRYATNQRRDRSRKKAPPSGTTLHVILDTPSDQSRESSVSLPRKSMESGPSELVPNDLLQRLIKQETSF